MRQESYKIVRYGFLWWKTASCYASTSWYVPSVSVYTFGYTFENSSVWAVVYYIILVYVQVYHFMYDSVAEILVWSVKHSRYWNRIVWLSTVDNLPCEPSKIWFCMYDLELWSNKTAVKILFIELVEVRLVNLIVIVYCLLLWCKVNDNITYHKIFYVKECKHIYLFFGYDVWACLYFYF